jgi:ketosteroid isomerase-like protein
VNSPPNRLSEIADKLRSRATGVLDAVDDCLAGELVVWHSFDDREQSIRGSLRAAHSRAKLAAFHRAMPGFERTITVLECPATSTVVELTSWTGAMEDVPAIPGSAGVSVDFKSVTIYTVVDGVISRIDVFDDPASSRAMAELTAYGGMST